MKCKLKLTKFCIMLFDSYSQEDDCAKHLFVLMDDRLYEIRCFRYSVCEYRMNKIGYDYFYD